MRKTNLRVPQLPLPALTCCSIVLLPLVGLGSAAASWAGTPIAPPATPQLAQASLSPSGDRILLNGQSLPIGWTQWSDPQKPGSWRIGISDFGLVQAIGVDLLNTNDAAKQPIQWFSQPNTTPIVLPTRRSQTQRYLDITDLAKQLGWQVQPRGAGLQITTPAAKLVSIRQGKQAWGDRLVLELDRATPWQLSQQGQDVTLTLNAQGDASLGSTFQPQRTNGLPTLNLESTPTQTRLRFTVSSQQRVRVWSLPNPNRLIVDIRPDVAVDRNLLWAPGLRWRQQTVSLGNDRFPVVWLEVNLRQPGIKLKPILPNPIALAGTAPLLQTARQNQVAAAINGGFFNRNNQLALGAVRLDDRWFSGPILNRGAIGWNAAGEMRFDRLTLQETIVTPAGQRLPITHLNSAYILPGIARYTTAWGQSYTALSDGEVAISVQAGRIASQQPVKLGTAIAIPPEGYLLVLRYPLNHSQIGGGIIFLDEDGTPIPLEATSTLLKLPNGGYLLTPTGRSSLTEGTSLQIESSTIPAEFQPYPQILAAGPLLLKNKQIVLDAKAEGFGNAFNAERASRSAIGRTPTGILMLVAVHDRLNGSSSSIGPGPSLAEMAQIMQQLGAIDALNLDGGSSTTLYLGRHVVDRPARSAARVHNGLGVFMQPNP